MNLKCLFEVWGKVLQTPARVSAFHSLAPLLSKSCFQPADVGVAGERGLPAAGTENIRLCSLVVGLLPPGGCLLGGPQGRRGRGLPNAAWARLPLPSSWWASPSRGSKPLRCQPVIFPNTRLSLGILRALKKVTGFW